MLLVAHPPPDLGCKKTRHPALDQPTRVVDVKKASFHALGINEPLTYPAKPPPYAGLAFTVFLQLQESKGGWSPTLPAPWQNFSENPVWKASLNLDFSLWSSSRERWCYCAVPRSIYKFVEEQQKLHTRKRERSPDLERYYASGQYDRDLEMRERAQRGSDKEATE